MPRAASGARTGTWVSSLLVLDPQHGEEGFLWDLDRPHHLHALLAFLLFLEELLLTRDVAAVALGEHVLALRLHGLARDDLAPDRGLDADVEHLLRDELAQLRHQDAADVRRLLAVDDDRERIHDRPRDEDVET